MGSLANIFWLGTKELRSFIHDYVLVGLVIWSFSFMVYAQAQSRSQELNHAAIAIIDEDNSPLSHYITEGFYLPPYFNPPQAIALRDVNRLMDNGRYTFILDIPLHFERDVLAGRQPAVQVNVDATAMVQAGLGASYIQQILMTQISNFLARSERAPPSPVTLDVRVAFNPNDTTSWFTSVMGIINNVTMLAIILSGAAVVREREHGTLDHLLVMPVTPFEIAMSKVWANGLVITLAVGLSLNVVVQGLLGIPVAGSVALFLAGVVIYLFFATAIGIFLATVARTMPQLGLLYLLVAVPMNVLSGSNTPLESMPRVLQIVMQISPSTHFVSFAQAILYRGAGLGMVWPEFLVVAFMGALFFGLALLRFRRSVAA
jgi:ABC-2 type transport system permease protein